MRILIIDDNLADAVLVQDVLEELAPNHYRFDILQNGNDAIKFLKNDPPKEQPDLIILDLGLPGKTGHEILQFIVDNNIVTPVLVYTTSDDPGDIEKAYNLNANCYIVKATDLRQLTEIMKTTGLFWSKVVRLPKRR